MDNLELCVFCEIEMNYIGSNGDLLCPDCNNAYDDPAYYDDNDTLADYYS